MRLPAGAEARVVKELTKVALGDERRTRRACAVIAKLVRSPAASLPVMLGSDAELQGCYRLLNNRAVSMQELLAGHIEATAERAMKAGRVLVVHDTTECAFAHLSPKEVGYLQTGKAGFKLHVSLVLDAHASRRPLGVVAAETLHRASRSKRQWATRASGSATARMEDRESQRWWRGVSAAGEALKRCERVIHVADREGDSYELMAKLEATKQRFVIRVRTDRRARLDESDPWSPIRQIAAACEGTLERDVPLSRRQSKATKSMTGAHLPRTARRARLQFAATRITIARPRYLRDEPPELMLNLVCVRELDPPPGEAAVEWLLYTTEPIDTEAQVASVVDDYRARWTIEEFNAALKTGCAYEDRELESRHALLAMLALSLPVACEVLALRSVARMRPSAPAMDVLNEQQLQVLRALGPHRLGAASTAREALLAVAAIGGHLRRNGEPGWKVLQRGMTLLLAYEVGWAARSAFATMN